MIRSDVLSKSEEVEALIRLGEYERALSEIKKIQARDSNEKRIQHHLLGRIYMNQGELTLAENELSRASNYGENIHLLMDLASLRHMKGQIYEWRLLCNEIDRVLDQSPKLQKSNLLQAKIFLGKFCEEDGLVVRAHKFYEDVLKEAGRSKNMLQMHAVALLNLTRVKAIYGLQKSQLPQCYQQLLSLNLRAVSKTLKAELQHSLMLAEMHLVGQEHAWFRVKNSMQGPDSLDEPDRRLLFYDFVYECLVLGRTLPADCVELRPTENLDTFERNVADVAFSGKSLFSVEEIQSWVAELSWTSHLRLLCLALSRELRPQWQKELRQKIDFFISTVDKRSQKIWMMILSHLFEQSKPVLNFEASQRVIRYRGLSVDLSKRKALYSLLDLLAKHSSIEIDSALKSLWNLPFSPESFHRLRMTAHRLNEILESLTGHSKMIDVSTDAVSWKKSVPLKMVH